MTLTALNGITEGNNVLRIMDASKGFDKVNPTSSFKDVLSKALGDVNSLQVEADKAVVKMITEPSKVSIHEVTTLLSQAEMALSLTKTVTDRVIHAYREITNLR